MFYNIVTQLLSH